MLHHWECFAQLRVLFILHSLHWAAIIISPNPKWLIQNSLLSWWMIGNISLCSLASQSSHIQVNTGHLPNTLTAVSHIHSQTKHPVCYLSLSIVATLIYVLKKRWRTTASPSSSAFLMFTYTTVLFMTFVLHVGVWFMVWWTGTDEHVKMKAVPEWCVSY